MRTLDRYNFSAPRCVSAVKLFDSLLKKLSIVSSHLTRDGNRLTVVLPEGIRAKFDHRLIVDGDVTTSFVTEKSPHARPSKCSSFVLISRFLFLNFGTVNIAPLVLRQLPLKLGFSQTRGSSDYRILTKNKALFNSALMRSIREVSR